MTTTFGEKLLASTEQHGRLCVGIDPQQELLKAWGLPNSVSGLAQFAEICVAAFSNTVAAVKPQVAFFERFGSQGFGILERTIAQLRENGCVVISDAKRGDIGSTMAGYAEAWLHPDSPLSSDAVTVSPFLGIGSLSPIFELAEDLGKGVFVLAATSNPEAASFQDRLDSTGRTVSQEIVDAVSDLNSPAAQRGALGNIGVVVGATLKDPPQLDRLGGPILMPGVGVQGGSHEDVRRIAGPMFPAAFPNVSRAVLSCGPDIGSLQKAVNEFGEFFKIRPVR